MTQTKEDLENIKSKLIEHIKSTYDEAQANEFIKKIETMNEEEFINFLKEQGILKEDGSPVEQKTQCIFCSLVFGEMPSTKIGENEKAIAILELNPISNGHSLVVPKEHIDKKENIPKEAYVLAKEIGEKIVKTFKPKDIKIVESEAMGHHMINILPIYGDETMESPRTKQTPEGLAEIQKQLEAATPEQITVPEKAEEPIKQEPEEEINEKNTWLPNRIP